MNSQLTTKTFSVLKATRLEALNNEAGLALGVFLLRHGFDGQAVSVGIVGQPDRNALLAYNTLMAPTANLVCLVPDSSVGGSALSVAELKALVQEGYELRTHVSDLTMVGRWSRLLTAIATQPIGIIDIDVAWATAESNFWQGLAEMLQAGTIIVRFNGLLRSDNAITGLQFLRGFLVSAEIEPVAASDNSVWLVASAHAPRIRNVLTSSGFFSAAADGTILSRSGALLDFITTGDAVPRSVVRLNNTGVAGHPIEFVSGWCSPEPDGCWTGSNEAVLGVVVPEAKERIVGVTITGNVWCAPGMPGQRLEFGIGRKPLNWKKAIIPDRAVEMVHLDVPSAETGKSLLLTVRVQDPGRPSDYGEDDSRLLGFKARDLIIYTSPG